MSTEIELVERLIGAIEKTTAAIERANAPIDAVAGELIAVDDATPEKLDRVIGLLEQLLAQNACATACRFTS